MSLEDKFEIVVSQCSGLPRLKYDGKGIDEYESPVICAVLLVEILRELRKK